MALSSHPSSGNIQVLAASTLPFLLSASGPISGYAADLGFYDGKEGSHVGKWECALLPGPFLLWLLMPPGFQRGSRCPTTPIYHPDCR